MTCGGTRCAFEEAHKAWRAGDLAGFLVEFHDYIEWIVHMDGVAMPYVSSAVGKADLLWRLQQLTHTFQIARFHVDRIEHGPDTCRSVVSILYIHRATGEPLDVKLRFTGWQENGIIVRCEERSDAAYVTAYDRFVQYLEGKRDNG